MGNILFMASFLCSVSITSMVIDCVCILSFTVIYCHDSSPNSSLHPDISNLLVAIFSYFLNSIINVCTRLNVASFHVICQFSATRRYCEKLLYYYHVPVYTKMFIIFKPIWPILDGNIYVTCTRLHVTSELEMRSKYLAKVQFVSSSFNIHSWQGMIFLPNKSLNLSHIFI